jgi:hypothetical protein
MDEIDFAEMELRRGQILWFRGLNRIQTQVLCWWLGLALGEEISPWWRWLGECQFLEVSMSHLP